MCRAWLKFRAQGHKKERPMTRAVGLRTACYIDNTGNVRGALRSANTSRPRYTTTKRCAVPNPWILDARNTETLQNIPCAVHTLNVVNALCNIQHFKRVDSQMSYTIYTCRDSVLQSNGKPKTNANLKPTVMTSRTSATATRTSICSKKLQ